MSIKKKIFMLNKLYQDLTRGKNFYSIAGDVHSQKLGEYYFLFDEARVRTGKDQALIADFDEDGIPLNKTYVDVESDKLIYFPISIGQMGLSVFHTYLKSQKDEDAQRFIKFADWYIDHAELSDGAGAKWMTHIPLPQYQNPGPWQSAFSQSRAISILLRAFQLTGKGHYKEIAEKALIPFTIPVAEGGVMSQTDWGPFYEEYTADVPVLVFNGHIFSMFGVYDFVRVIPDNEKGKFIFNSGYNSLIHSLSTFDLGHWTRYNYCQADYYPKVDTATLSYHRLHILLLKVMDKIRSSPEIESCIIRWENQISVKNILNAYISKYSQLKKLNRI